MPDIGPKLRAKAEREGIRVPTAKTLAKFGLTDIEWLILLANQDWRCGVCHGKKARWNTDHEHVPGWMKMPPELRKIYVRGVLCWFCNKFTAPSNMQTAEARNLLGYLMAYEDRRNHAEQAAGIR